MSSSGHLRAWALLSFLLGCGTSAGGDAPTDDAAPVAESGVSPSPSAGSDAAASDDARVPSTSNVDSGAPAAPPPDSSVLDSGSPGASDTSTPDASDASFIPDASDSDASDTSTADASDATVTADASDADSEDAFESAAPPDASDAALPTPPGLIWPPGQSFPSFPLVGPLDVIDVTTLTADQTTLVVTLAGLVNRTKPRIYTIDDGGEGKTFWLDQLGVPITTFTDPLALLAKYEQELSGIVIYDDTQVDTLNLATTMAGIEGGVVSSPALSTTLEAAPYALPVIADLRTNAFTSNIEVYQYELDQLGSLATPRLMCGLDPTIVGNLRDYAVATESVMVWLDPRVAAEDTLLQQFFARLQPDSPYMGWWPDEGSGVSTASTSGVPVFASDYASNLTVFGGTPRGIAVPTPPPAPPLETKMYVTMIMSDGDNVQLDQHLVPTKWADTNRGNVPIGWTMSPAFVDLAPMILDYYWRTATANDVLVSGPSGLGYTYPGWWPLPAFDGYATQSAGYLDAAGLRVITVWNLSMVSSGDDGADLSVADALAYTEYMPHLLGLTLQGEYVPIVHDLTILNGSLPLMRLAQTYGTDESDLESGINQALSAWTHLAPSFVAVQGDLNSGSIDPTAFYDVQQSYASNTDLVFVRSDHFFELLRQANGLPVNP